MSGVQPLPLRRTSSNVKRPSNIVRSVSNSSESNLVVADEEQISAIDAAEAQKHKRKHSHVPLDLNLSESGMGRGSEGTGGLELIGDDEEGGDDEEDGGGSGGFHSPNEKGYSSMSIDGNPEVFLFSDSNGSGGMSLKKSVLALFAFLAVGVLVVFRPGSGGPDVRADKTDDSKGTTQGEEHEEVVGPGKAFEPVKYNKVHIYSDPSKMPRLESQGPYPSDRDLGGLQFFENVCVTNNDDTYGLVYFTDQKEMLDNSKRCVPCSNSEYIESWNTENEGSQAVGHNCGMNGLNAMYAESVPDWNDCTAETENQQLIKEYRQIQSPGHAETVHFFQEPTFLLQFDAEDMAASLIDTLLTYLPHWHKFREEGKFPFKNVFSHSVDGCLSHSHGWFCEIAHQMQAFGTAKETPIEDDDSTLYCFKKLYYNQLAYWRHQKTAADNSQEIPGVANKAMMDEFRDILNRKFALPRPRDMSPMRKKDAALGLERRHKVLFYANKPNGGDGGIWKGMDDLIASARSADKYADVDFSVVEDFGNLTVAEEARAFNINDVVIMVRGQQMANAVFSPSGAVFVELGCRVPTLIGDSRFMKMIDGTYRSATRCGDGGPVTEPCVACEGDANTDGSFTMKSEAFEALMDEVLTDLRNEVP